jgi:nitroimidazol reductase NimA-like FMN-containing flavoprotein (pyridoxamine 5'-phosphate oxidase superfamily)
MRKSSREVTLFEEQVDILRRCDTVRIGLNNNGLPYIVPLSFGMEVTSANIIVLYAHGAPEGQKYDLIQRDGRVCIEADIFHCYFNIGPGITTAYESVIGYGTIEEVQGAEKLKGMQLICEHCDYDPAAAAQCPILDQTAVFKITIQELTGKRMLAE